MRYNEMTTDQQSRIQELKSTILFFAPSYKGNLGLVEQHAEECIMAVSSDAIGFPSEVAKTVLNYNRISEKQAFVIAMAIVDQNLTLGYEELSKQINQVA